MESEEHPYREAIRYALVALLAGAVLDVAFEVGRARRALADWICANTPTPAGPDACGAAFLLRWHTARFPLYVVYAGAAALVIAAVAMLVRRAAPGAVPWNRLVRIVAALVCGVALAELVACSGDATCGLSVSCT